MLYRKIAFYILDSRINFSICCENCHVCLAAIFEKNRPAGCFGNVSSGHFEEKKGGKKRLLLPFFHRGRTLNMFVFLLCLLLKFAF